MYLNGQNKPWIVIEGSVDFELVKNYKFGLDNSVYINNDKRIFLYAGGVYEKYGLRNLVEGFLNTQIPNIELHIYGGIDPDYKEEFELLLSDNSFVTYEGVVNAEDAVSILQKHDVLLFPTRFPDEGIPGTIIDAFASGIPIISSKWLYFDELFEDHKTALGYDFLNVDSLVDTIIYAAKNTEELINIGRNGQKEYGKYDSSAVLPVLVNQLL